jgi:hypothetical protein
MLDANTDAWAAILELRKRAKLLFGAESRPEWYLFPHAEGFTTPDPTKPMSGWRTAWRNLTRAILCPACTHLQNPGETCRNEQCKADIRDVKSPLVDCASTTFGITPSRSLPSRRPTTVSSVRLRDTSRPECSHSTHTSAWKRSARSSMHSLAGV